MHCIAYILSLRDERPSSSALVWFLTPSKTTKCLGLDALMSSNAAIYINLYRRDAMAEPRCLPSPLVHKSSVLSISWVKCRINLFSCPATTTGTSMAIHSSFEPVNNNSKFSHGCCFSRSFGRPAATSGTALVFKYRAAEPSTVVIFLLVSERAITLQRHHQHHQHHVEQRSTLPWV